MTPRTSPFAPRYPFVWGAFVLLLLVPLVAMRMTREVNWTAGDFAVAAILLFGAALGFEVAARIGQGRWQRRIAVGVILIAMLAIWAQGAVGIV